MHADAVSAVVWALVVLGFVVAIVSARLGKRRAIYDLLNQDKRNAIELIVDDKAAARDPESADGTPHP